LIKTFDQFYEFHHENDDENDHEKSKIKALRATFVGLWDLERNDTETNKTVKKAIENPEGFVLKAQLGGRQIKYYGDDLKRELEKISPKERRAYTLMEKIHPISVKVV
jgi:hypothetical protein